MALRRYLSFDEMFEFGSHLLVGKDIKDDTKHFINKYLQT